MEIIDRLAVPVFAVDAQFVVEQAVAAQIFKADLGLALAQLVLRDGIAHFADPARADAAAPDGGHGPLNLAQISGNEPLTRRGIRCESACRDHACKANSRRRSHEIAAAKAIRRRGGHVLVSHHDYPLTAVQL